MSRQWHIWAGKFSLIFVPNVDQVARSVNVWLAAPGCLISRFLNADSFRAADSGWMVLLGP